MHQHVNTQEHVIANAFHTLKPEFKHGNETPPLYDAFLLLLERIHTQAREYTYLPTAATSKPTRQHVPISTKTPSAKVHAHISQTNPGQKQDKNKNTNAPNTQKQTKPLCPCTRSGHAAVD